MKLKYKSSLVEVKRGDDEKSRWRCSAQERCGSGAMDGMHSVEVSLEKDGSLFFVDGTDMVYLYPEQVKQLKKILGMK